jgi:uncharacterized protein YqgV (UPF0045/DUF77 family)
MQFITALPTVDHNDESTVEAIYRAIATLRTAGVTYHLTPGCTGIWYDGDTEYRNDAVLVEMDGNEAAIKRALARFGEDAAQYEVLLVERVGAFVQASGTGEACAVDFAKRLGGATLMPNGIAVSFKYAALVHGRDYVSTVTGAVK